MFNYIVELDLSKVDNNDVTDIEDLKYVIEHGIVKCIMNNIFENWIDVANEEILSRIDSSKNDLNDFLNKYKVNIDKIFEYDNPLCHLCEIFANVEPTILKGEGA